MASYVNNRANVREFIVALITRYGRERMHTGSHFSRLMETQFYVAIQMLF